MIGGDLLSYLDGIPDFADAVSSRRFLDRIPQKTALPCVVVTLISGNADYALTTEISDAEAVLQVGVHATSRKQAAEIAEIIRTAPVSGYLGLWRDTWIHSVTIQNEIDLDFLMSDSSDDRIFVQNTDYKVAYTRTVVSAF